jgi:hypothetical protein
MQGDFYIVQLYPLDLDHRNRPSAPL